MNTIAKLHEKRLRVANRSPWQTALIMHGCLAVNQRQKAFISSQLNRLTQYYFRHISYERKLFGGFY